jgi:hypothetical protein
MACFMAAVDSGSLDSYLGLFASPGSRYLAAMYWAMTTLSTVGYGDITPTSDVERGYSMMAMVVGGAFYGYIIGSVTSVISEMDLNTRAYFDRMDLITSWLDGHDELPKILRRRIRKHFKESLATRTAIDDPAVVWDLSPELRADTAFFIIHEKVRCNPMFYELPNSALPSLVEIIRKTQMQACERIVSCGDPGIAMYILVEGFARFDQGEMWLPPQMRLSEAESMVQATKSRRFHQVTVGDSFGEEIIFGLEENYLYTVVAVSAATLFSISEDGFKDQFKNMPELHESMYQSFLLSKAGDSGVDVLHGKVDVGLSLENGTDAPAKKGDTPPKASESKLRSWQPSHNARRGFGQKPYNQGHRR